MGEVYRARDPRTGRDVAIKVAAEQFGERFSREVHAIAALNHPNISSAHASPISRRRSFGSLRRQLMAG
jgi:serine/threonine protein kinase